MINIIEETQNKILNKATSTLLDRDKEEIFIAVKIILELEKIKNIKINIGELCTNIKKTGEVH